MKHTQGPWAWQKFGNVYSLTAQHGMREIIIGANPQAANGVPMMVMNNDGRLQPIDPTHPNAKLIAAAPDLLKCLQMFVDAWHEDHPGERMGAYNLALGYANVPIAKATAHE